MHCKPPNKPLCIDCDGTLLRTDLLHESLISLLLRRPWMLGPLLLWFCRGRAYTKGRLAAITDLNVSALPFRKELLEFMKERKASGSQMFLVTAANMGLASAVAQHCGLFDEVLASDSRVNLKGPVKSAALVKRFGHKGFHYAGDSSSDLVVWESADEAILVGHGASLQARVSEINSNIKVVGPEKAHFLDWLKLIRIHQWAKNIIVFIPLVAAHQVFDVRTFAAAASAFFALSFVASATYILNDLFDLENDRAHRSKQYRPLASGMIGLPAGTLVGLLFLLLGSGIALFLPPTFGFCLVLYVVLTISYSFALKKVALVDTIVLAALYTLRLLAGHAATEIKISVWLLAFSIFLFFSLAMVKRYVEVRELVDSQTTVNKQVTGRGYQASDLWLIGSLGISCGVLSALILILYVNSSDVLLLYNHPLLLMLLAPVFLYWIGRVWLLASRGSLHEDPVLFALHDKSSYVVVLMALLVIMLAAGLP
jgi:4-hydroxybenzoate polyprenyltransferase/phosphoserine phosphatase